MTRMRPKPGKSGASDQPEASKKYRDRPADEGKHGDGGEEPNAGLPSPARDAPGRPKAGSSRQQTHRGQLTQTGSPELDGKS
jgi:hypothetical protein